MILNIELQDYIKRCILLQYKNYDLGHNMKHIQNVIKDSLAIARDYDVDINMVYVVAAYHDIGLINGREDHHITSAKALENDEHLKKWFDFSEIIIMKEAVEDHRASSNKVPRTIYGKIIADADREIDMERVLYRVMQYGKDHFPQYSLEEQSERSFNHIVDKYGENGYMHLYLDSGDSLRRLKELQQLLADRAAFDNRFSKYY